MTNTEKNVDTKNKIIKAANELFADHGFAGASVRDIASKAEVNLAAINYHFTNKENLYWQVFDYNYNWISDTIADFGKECSNTEDLTAKTFHFFIENEIAMMNTFKLIISGMSPPEGITVCVFDQKKFGPPGQVTFFQKIEGDLKIDLSEDSKLWATKMIFSLLFHFGVMLNTKMMKARCESEDHLKPERMEASLRHSVKAHLEYLKKNHAKMA